MMSGLRKEFLEARAVSGFIERIAGYDVR